MEYDDLIEQPFFDNDFVYGRGRPEHINDWQARIDAQDAPESTQAEKPESDAYKGLRETMAQADAFLNRRK